MVLANIEWLGTYCLVLSHLCAAQLIVTTTLAFTIPDILFLTGSHFSTGAGMIAGFVALPTFLRLKISQISPNMDRIYGYTICYQRLAVCVSAALHLTSIFLTIVALGIVGNLQLDFMDLMKIYNRKPSSKMLVDNVQYILQCCGGTSYKNWFNIDWSGYSIENHKSISNASIQELLKEDTDAFPDLTFVRNDMVPYSCCSRSVLISCIHQNLIQLGVRSINTQGCGVKLTFMVRVLLGFELIVYTACFCLEAVVLILLREQDPISKTYQSKVNLKLKAPNDWDTFSNVQSYLAEINPSSHSQLTVNSNPL